MTLRPLLYYCLTLSIEWANAFSVAGPPSTAAPFLRSPSSRRHAVLDETAPLYEPQLRNDTYGSISSENENGTTNWAQYLVDLHDAKATFDFCGGMMFQLSLTDDLRDHLVQVAANDESEQQQPEVFDATKFRMHQIPDYQPTAHADNCRVFHGREVRRVPNAAGGMGMVLQLSKSYATNETATTAATKVQTDPQGWTVAEIQGYDGWNHDGGRVWREGQRLTAEGCPSFVQQFGTDAFCLHHRFYLHLDSRGAMWLSAEDGCEGTPSAMST